MNVGNIYDTSVKIFPSDAGLINFDGYLGYLLAFVCYGAFTQTFDLVKRNLSHCSSCRNMSSHRLIVTNRHFRKICLKPHVRLKFIFRLVKPFYTELNQNLVGLGPQGRLRPTRLENSEA